MVQVKPTLKILGIPINRGFFADLCEYFAFLCGLSLLPELHRDRNLNRKGRKVFAKVRKGMPWDLGSSGHRCL